MRAIPIRRSPARSPTRSCWVSGGFPGRRPAHAPSGSCRRPDRAGRDADARGRRGGRAVGGPPRDLGKPGRCRTSWPGFAGSGGLFRCGEDFGAQHLLQQRHGVVHAQQAGQLGGSGRVRRRAAAAGSRRLARWARARGRRPPRPHRWWPGARWERGDRRRAGPRSRPGRARSCVRRGSRPGARPAQRRRRSRPRRRPGRARRVPTRSLRARPAAARPGSAGPG